jgi:hypothetical protein
MEAEASSNPFYQLDALYLHILEFSPDPPLSVLWIRTIDQTDIATKASALNINLLLQMDPER